MAGPVAGWMRRLEEWMTFTIVSRCWYRVNKLEEIKDKSFPWKTNAEPRQDRNVWRLRRIHMRLKACANSAHLLKPKQSFADDDSESGLIGLISASGRASRMHVRRYSLRFGSHLACAAFNLPSMWDWKKKKEKKSEALFATVPPYQFSCIHRMASSSLNCLSNSYSCRASTDMVAALCFSSRQWNKTILVPFLV